MHKGLLAIIVAAAALTVAFPSFVVNVGFAAGGDSSNAYTVAVVGDTPYGAQQAEDFGTLVRRINRDPKVDAVRSEFFPTPGTTLGGRKKRVQAQDGFPENVLWTQSQVVFGVVHVVGSNNGLAPSWTREIAAG